MKHASGVTLVEVLMAAVILAFVMGVVVTVLVAGNRSVADSQAQISATVEARRGLEEMTRELIRAPVGEITGGTDPSNLTSPWPPAADWTGIRFRYPEGVDATGTVNSWSSYVAYAWDPDAEQLIRTDETTGATRVLANGVTTAAFRQGDAVEEVWIELTTHRDSMAGHQVWQPLGIRIRVRNE